MNLKEKAMLSIDNESFLIRYRLQILRMGLIALGVALVFILDYRCPFLYALDIPCLGCGMSRAWKALLMGDFMGAFYYHRAFWTVPILCAYIWRSGRLFKNKVLNGIILLVVLLLFIENYTHNLL